MDAGERLSAGTPAVIGEVIDKQGAGSVGNPPYDDLYTYTVRVERAFNTDLGDQLTIRANTNGAACGFSWSVGQRIGAFLYRDGDEWQTSSCNLVAPAALEAAAKKPTEPTEPDPPTGGKPGSDDAPSLRARRGPNAVNAGPRSGKHLARLVVKPGARIRLRLDKAAKTVRVGLARPNGKRLGGMHPTRAIGNRQLAWLAKLPRSLPRQADRLLVSIDYGGERVKLAVGLTTDCQAPGRLHAKDVE